MLEYIDYIKKNKLGDIYLDKSFKDITTIRIGGNINLLYYPNTIDNFIKFYRYYLITKKYPLIVIGNGSNILASSDNYIGIVVSFKKISYKYTLFKDTVNVCSGVMINDLINYLKNNNISGLEQLYYIPATIGGMVKMNAGAYNKTISDNLLYIECINNDGEIEIYKKEDIHFNYRYSSIPKEDIILTCGFKLSKTNKIDINNTIQKIKKNRIDKQPLDKYNAGSTFKNTEKYNAWYLIDKINFRGYSINDAEVSNKHCNFLINKENSSSDDMIKLINSIKNEVKKQYNIILECEWNFINFKKSIYFS